jgi:hypothetical protein
LLKKYIIDRVAIQKIIWVVSVDIQRQSFDGTVQDCAVAPVRGSRLTNMTYGLECECDWAAPFTPGTTYYKTKYLLSNHIKSEVESHRTYELC